MHLPKDPLDRFIRILEALNEGRGWFSDASPLRFAALSAIMCPGDPAAIARSVRNIADELKERSGWFGELNGSLRFLIAAGLLQNQDNAASFMSEVDRVRKLFREARTPRGGSFEIISVLILRGADKRHVSLDLVRRMKEIHDEMKKHQWWITGAADLPACAILAKQEGSPQSLGQDAEDMYQELHRAGFKKGDPLQTAANLLCLSEEKPRTLALRYTALADTFRQEGTRIWRSEYDELAILSFLDIQPNIIVSDVLRCQDAISQVKPKPGRNLAFNLATSVAFVGLVEASKSTDGLTEAKAMLDMQTIICAQQAAMVAATTAAVAASSAASSS